MYAAYRMKKDGTERNYRQCGNDLPTYSLALDDAQRIYETDPSYSVEVRCFKYQNVSCSQCGDEFGPGDHGYSHCADHGLSNDAKDRIKQAISNEERPTASSKHTPGPWHMGAGNGEGGIFADDGRMRFENGTTLYPIASVDRKSVV